MFAKGKSYQQALIDDYYQITIESIQLIKNLIDETKHKETAELISYAKEVSNGDKEVELSILNHYNHIINDSLIYESFYESYYVSIYSFYEKMLKLMSRTKKRIKSKNGLSFCSQYIDIIQKQLEINTFNEKTNKYIT